MSFWHIRGYPHQDIENINNSFELDRSLSFRWLAKVSDLLILHNSRSIDRSRKTFLAHGEILFWRRYLSQRMARNASSHPKHLWPSELLSISNRQSISTFGQGQFWESYCSTRLKAYFRRIRTSNGAMINQPSIRQEWALKDTLAIAVVFVDAAIFFFSCFSIIA